MKLTALCLLIFTSLPLFCSKLIKEDFYSPDNDGVVISRCYQYGKNDNLEKIVQDNDGVEIVTDYKYEKNLLTEAKEYNDDIFVSASLFLYHDGDVTPYRRENYDSMKNLKSYSLFTYMPDGVNPQSIQTYNNKNELLERMVFVYSDGVLEQIQIFDESDTLQMTRIQSFDKHKNAAEEKVVFRAKTIRTIKRSFNSPQKVNKKIFSLSRNFFDFK